MQNCCYYKFLTSYIEIPDFNLHNEQNYSKGFYRKSLKLEKIWFIASFSEKNE